MKNNPLAEYIGTLPKETGQTKRIRFHQGWWRAFVLNEKEGNNPVNNAARVCNTILLGEETHKNFLTPSAIKSVADTKLERKTYAAGLFDENRLFNNLLSSQPLAFNFFGELKQDLALATKVISQFLPAVQKVENVFFEFAPPERYTNDNSAFDVAFEVISDGKKGLFGLECKYTDSFSPTEYDNAEYREVFAKSPNFLETYDVYKASRFNQLFRNQLIAEALVQNKKYEFCMTGLFCFEGDAAAIQIGNEFQQMIKGKAGAFKVIQYADFIEKAQQLPLSWAQREWTMLLWARYCALSLSELALKNNHG